MDKDVIASFLVHFDKYLHGKILSAYYVRNNVTGLSCGNSLFAKRKGKVTYKYDPHFNPRKTGIHALGMPN